MRARLQRGPGALLIRTALVLTALIGGLYWKLFTRQYTWMDHPDTAWQVLPWFEFQAREWQAGRIPLWDPHVWGGQPLLGQMQPGAAFPLNWGLWLWPLHHLRIAPMAMHGYFLALHLLAAWFAYALCRDLGRSRMAAVLGGVLFSAAGSMGSLGWPQMLNGALWLPLVWLYLLRVVRGRDSAASAIRAGLCLGAAFLSGHHQIPLFMALAAAAMWAWMMARRLTAWRHAALFAIFAAGVSALQVLPAMEYGRHALRWVGSQNPVSWKQVVPYAVHERYSLRPMEAIGAVVANLGGYGDAYVGLCAALLAGIGVAAMWRRREVRLLAALAVGGLFLALGSWSWLHGALYLAVPGFNKARTPALAIVLTIGAVAALAAYGLDSLRVRGVLGRTRTMGRVLVTGAAVAAAVLAPLSRIRPATGHEYDSLALAAMAAAMAALTFAAWRRGAVSARGARAALVFVVLFELGHVVGANYRHREQPGGFLAGSARHDDTAQWLKRRGGFPRIETDPESVPYNFGDWHGIDQYPGYLGGVLANVAQVEIHPRGRELFALQYHVGDKPRAGARLVAPSLYEYPDALQRVWVVHRTVGPVAVKQALDDPAFDPRTAAFFSGPAPAVENCSGSTARLVERESDRLAIEADLKCRGLVVASEPWYPGWVAKVDGAAVPLLETNGALRAVTAGAGRHRIEMIYRPAAVYIGGALTLLAGACGIMLSAYFRRRREG